MGTKPSKSPKSDSPRTGRGKIKVEWKGYVNLTLTEAQKSGYTLWLASAQLWQNDIPTLLNSGYTLSLAYDEYHHSAVAGLYCIDPKNPNAGWKLTAHATDPEDALCRLLFIHGPLLEGNWSDGFQPELDAW